MQNTSSIAIRIFHGDAFGFGADVLVLKHAQALYGVDKAACNLLAAAGVPVALPPIGRHAIVRSDRAFAAAHVLFIGVEAVDRLDYREIRDFGRLAMAALARALPTARHVALTLHGTGYGLDETEAFESELAGVIDGITHDDPPAALETITFVEKDAARARRLVTVLQRLLPTGRIEWSDRAPLGLGAAAVRAMRTAGVASAAKPRVFVAMPFADEMSDVFHYGIQGAVNRAGLLAERADLATFTGDVMDWVRTRIASADLVIGDLTSSSPNVFLEVGYAWGKGIPTVLIAKETEVLKFDVRGQRCLLYASIRQLEEKLERELAGLRDIVGPDRVRP